MFYSQCWTCGERWALGTASTCKCPYELPAYTFKPPSEPVFAFLDTKPSHNITFHNGDKQVGVLDFNGPEMTFSGDMDESAKVFFDFIATTFKARLEHERADEREATNNAYRERNQLVALLSTLFPSGKAKTAIEGWDDAWHGCVYIDFPWGQASWHYHTDDEWMFEHLPPYTKEWDGHSTEAKYAMIALAIRARSNT